MPTSLSVTLKEILERIGPKVTDQWPCRQCGAMQPIKILSVQADLCGPCLGEQRQSLAAERIRQQVGPKYAHCEFGNFRETKSTLPVVEALRQFVKEPKGGVFLFGASGTGKTHLATAMMRTLLQQGMNCDYVTMPELVIRLKRSFDPSQAGSEEELLAKYNSDILILDDLGVGPVTDWVCQIVHLLLDKRDRFLKPTVVISNLAPDRIAMLFGDPIASRIAGMCRILRLDGEDRRLKGPALKTEAAKK